MRYSDVAQKYYKDTKNRILENVLAAENGGERSDGRIIGERESKEKNIMTNSTAIIRNSKGIIAAACALVMLGSSTFVMHRLRASDDREVSSRPDKVRSTVVTSSDEDTSSEVNEEDNETAPDADDSTSEKSAEKKQEKKNDSGETTSAAEKADNSNVVVLKDDSAKKTDNGTNSDNSTPVSTVNDSTASADSSSKADITDPSADSQQADSTADIDYSLDEDSYVNEDLYRQIDRDFFLCEGTVFSKEIYGDSVDGEYKPLSEYAPEEFEKVRSLYIRFDVKLDGICLKGEDMKPFYAMNTGIEDEMSLAVPADEEIYINNGISTDYYLTYIKNGSPDIFNIGDKVLIERYGRAYIDGRLRDEQVLFKYDFIDKMYHYCSYYLSIGDYDVDIRGGITNYILNTFKGGTPEAAEQWVNYLGESYTIKYIPSMRFASGEVVSVNYSQPDGCYVIYVAE
ncbi:hypothetical protein [Ruminococcus albus]|uniref:Gram-positive signal peptide protein, YSIRK family n=1 Tax=Ruminococcus albus 8 TaxID=246199 RepID=E9SDY2_RUMAL|nr:hypothetical protein [Ruminococcus albus]EGC02516.1 hypothetical protein CUS_5039 [Ruminococcus albus 8]MCC3350841.1 hypothetical protein [Ruminococcus albus 8]